MESTFERQEVLNLLRRFGREAHSFQVLQSHFKYWFGDAQACVAYVDTGRAWVAAGSPIAARDRVKSVALAFMDEARRHHRRTLFFGIESDLSDTTDFRSIPVGMSPMLDVNGWAETLDFCRRLKSTLNSTRSRGLRVSRLRPDECSASQPRGEMAALTRSWLRAKALPPMGFLADIQPFSFAAERRYFTAHMERRLMGFAVMTPIYESSGWLIEHLIRDPAATAGTVETLIDAAICDARCSGSKVVSLGLTPLAGPISPWLSAAKRLGSPYYNFKGLERFRAKLRPHTWGQVYVAYPHSQWSPIAVYDTLVAFARGSLLRFGAQTVAGALQGLWGDGGRSDPLPIEHDLSFIDRIRTLPAE